MATQSFLFSYVTALQSTPISGKINECPINFCPINVLDMNCTDFVNCTPGFVHCSIYALARIICLQAVIVFINS